MDVSHWCNDNLCDALTGHAGHFAPHKTRKSVFAQEFIIMTSENVNEWASVQCWRSIAHQRCSPLMSLLVVMVMVVVVIAFQLISSSLSHRIFSAPFCFASFCCCCYCCCRFLFFISIKRTEIGHFILHFLNDGRQCWHVEWTCHDACEFLRRTWICKCPLMTA